MPRISKITSNKMADFFEIRNIQFLRIKSESHHFQWFKLNSKRIQCMQYLLNIHVFLKNSSFSLAVQEIPEISRIQIMKFKPILFSLYSISYTVQAILYRIYFIIWILDISGISCTTGEKLELCKNTCMLGYTVGHSNLI